MSPPLPLPNALVIEPLFRLQGGLYAGSEKCSVLCCVAYNVGCFTQNGRLTIEFLCKIANHTENF